MCLNAAINGGYTYLTKDITETMSHYFYSYGKFCTSHQWEVIVTFLTLAICVFSMGSLRPRMEMVLNKCEKNDDQWTQRECYNENDPNTDVVIVTIMRGLALLYVYHQFRNLSKLGSKYLVGIAGLFTVFSSFIFCSGVVNVLNGNFSELNKAMPLFLLLADLPKASLLARFALSSFSKDEVRENIARGMAIIGPSLTLDTLVETLAIGVGAISGVSRLEELSCFACMSIIVNYLIFMTIFPSCLSLALELSHNREEDRPVWQLSTLTKVLQLESEHAPNPVIQRVKLIMSAGLMSVHMVSFWEHGAGKLDNVSHPAHQDFTNNNNGQEMSAMEMLFKKRMVIAPEQMVMLGIVCILVVKYIFFENKDSNDSFIAAAEKHQKESILKRENEHNLKEGSIAPKLMEVSNGRGTPTILVTSQDSDTESVIAENKAKRPISPRSQANKNSPAFFIGDDSASDFSEDIELCDKEVQTIEMMDRLSVEARTVSLSDISEHVDEEDDAEPRDLQTLNELLKTVDGPKRMSDKEILLLVEKKYIPSYKLETVLDDPERGVKIRRQHLVKQSSCGNALQNLPYENYDYKLVLGACCENVVGFMPLPLGVAGPLLLDNMKYFVPMATTEGCLVASTNRGCLALTAAGGVRSSVVGDGMTRGPVVRFPNSVKAAEVMNWLQEEENFLIIKDTFDSTSRFARVTRIHPRIAGRYLFLRFTAKTGDAMGMNMLSKGTECALNKLQELFPEMEIISLSGNFCTDKKPSAVNWIEGRGKSVVCEAEIPAKIVRDVLKTTVPALVDVNVSKNLIGSAMAGSIGGFNAQAANIVTAIYIATGQDPAQCIGSSNCMTLIESSGKDNENLYISCTMPSLELGTIGGGTILGAQAACLELLGVRGSSSEDPGCNAKRFARVVCATVLAAELSLLSALAAGHLVRSHMKHNRSAVSINASPVCSAAKDLDKKANENESCHLKC
ncbi:3-hydroxy-3-methylglutaryl-coenzyme A reductase-like protein [Leptotrombidium deliense]|uniref:3-hydroxy-3-methylglutaryl coenzyme A reductase n=1 Tax=Leptotrombidium deliense TaxID=299467 RepID=A0A443SJ87_9ACAR|nr:3-hydroxy-3-methylglutaryl-coenzyme A reductase-like protein [Leptotrombidium deliense]